MEVNARGIITCRVFGNLWPIKGGGSIINIASIYGMVAPDEKYEDVDFETVRFYFSKDYFFYKIFIILLLQYNVRVNFSNWIFNNDINF